MKESTRHCADVAERDISKDIYSLPKAYLLKIRGGVEVDSYGKKAGKGPLIQEEVSATIGTNQDQYLFQPIGVDIYNFSVTGEKSRCLSTSCGGLNEHIPVVIESALPILDDQGGSRISVRMDGKAPTLRAETHDHLPCVLQTAGFKPSQGSKAQGMGWENEKAPTILAGQTAGVCITFEPGVASRDGGHVYTDVCGTLRAIPGDNRMTVVYGVTCKGNGDAFINPTTHTSLTVGGGQAGQGYPCVLLVSENIAGTLDSHYWKGQGEREGVERTFVVLMKGEILASHEDDCEGNEVFYEAYQHHGWRESVVAGTLTADQNNRVRGDTPVIVMATQQGGSEIAVNLCPTITAAAGMSGNNQPVVCIEGNGSRPSHFGDGYKESDVMYTLNTIDRHAVAYESNKP